MMASAPTSHALVSPTPKIHHEELAHVGAGLRFMESPTNYLKELREKHGDTFLVDIFGYQLFMTFSPRGLESLYKFEEDEASFHMATFDMIRFKTPLETLLYTDSKYFYQLLMNKKMPQYLGTIAKVVDMELDRWGSGGELEIFDAIRTLEQRVGYGVWIAEEAAQDGNWQALKQQFDVLDQEKAFVDPADTLETIKTDKAREKAAARELGKLIPDILQQHDNNPDKHYAGADFFRALFAGEDNFDTRVTNNLINANQGFLSNLYAAIAWVIVRLAEHDDVLQRVTDEINDTRKTYGDDCFLNVDALNAMTYLEQVMMESVRIAQRSLTLRKVMKAVDFDDGEQVYSVQPGVYIATMLSVTNTQTAELQRFDPEHYEKNQLAKTLDIAGKETISTFGHGKHACPAQRFSHHMVKVVVVKLLERFTLSSGFEQSPAPSSKQMGGVSRPEQPTYIKLQAKP